MGDNERTRPPVPIQTRLPLISEEAGIVEAGRPLLDGFQN